MRTAGLAVLSAERSVALSSLSNEGRSPQTNSVEESGYISTDGSQSSEFSLTKAETLSIVIPSRSLELRNVNSPALQTKILTFLETYWQLRSSDFSNEVECLNVSFFDIRDSTIALQELNGKEFGDNPIGAMYLSQGFARDFDEEGRIIVCVEEHLNIKELHHIFSTYGSVRNIQDVPNVNVHKVVEFFDVRDAQKAMCALNGGGSIATEENSIHAASVAYIQKTRYKPFLIPPRLPTEMKYNEDELPFWNPAAPTTLPLFSNKKQTNLKTTSSHQTASIPSLIAAVNLMHQSSVTDPSLSPLSAAPSLSALRKLRDSSSSLISDANGEETLDSAYPSVLEKDVALLIAEEDLERKHGPESIDFKGIEEGDLCLRELSVATSSTDTVDFPTKQVLPSGLGLYEDELSPQQQFRHSESLHASSNPNTTTTNFPVNLMQSINSQQLPFEVSNNPLNIDNENYLANCNALSNMASSDLAGNPLLAQIVAASGLSLGFGQADGMLGTQMGDQETLVMAQWLKGLKDAALLQQLINIEVQKRLNALKMCNTNVAAGESHMLSGVQPFYFPKVDDNWKRSEKTIRKKNGRLSRRNSAIDIQQEVEKRAQQEKMYALDIDRVLSGHDKRTTLMIKNIPNKYTQQMLLTRIEQDFKGTFDFFYLPIDFKNRCNVGYGFINMTKLEYIPPFVEHVHEQKWDKFNSDKVCCVTYARIQGRHALINHFQNSSLMLEESKHQPLLFDSTGDPEHFPIEPIT